MKDYFKQIAYDNHKFILSKKILVPKTIRIDSNLMEIFSMYKPKIRFMKMTTLDAVKKILSVKPHYKITILNFANGVHPTGGYKNGAIAQEEDLCRRMPTLAASLLDAKRIGLYPFGPTTGTIRYSSVLLTKDVAITRDYNLQPLIKQQWKYVDVISAVAPNRNIGELLDPKYMLQTICNIFNAPLKYQGYTDVIIVGALGCGAFKNDPSIIAKLFNLAIKTGLANGYKYVIFAIPPGYNYNIFYNEFLL